LNVLIFLCLLLLSLLSRLFVVRVVRNSVADLS
jgi:hypothetical protein